METSISQAKRTNIISGITTLIPLQENYDRFCNALSAAAAQQGRARSTTLFYLNHKGCKTELYKQINKVVEELDKGAHLVVPDSEDLLSSETMFTAQTKKIIKEAPNTAIVNDLFGCGKPDCIYWIACNEDIIKKETMMFLADDVTEKDLKSYVNIEDCDYIKFNGSNILKVHLG